MSARGRLESHEGAARTSGRRTLIPSTSISVRVLFFGPLAGWLGTREVSLSLPASARLRDASRALARLYPERAEFLAQARLARNARFGGVDEHLEDGDELAVIELTGGG